jgi:hypothetical protein
VTWQLRLYGVHEGEWDAWISEWRERILPLRLAEGFEVLGPWRTEDGRFAWMIGHEDFAAAAAAAYFASPERAELDPDPARHLSTQETILLEPF